MFECWVSEWYFLKTEMSKAFVVRNYSAKRCNVHSEINLVSLTKLKSRKIVNAYANWAKVNFVFGSVVDYSALGPVYKEVV